MARGTLYVVAVCHVVWCKRRGRRRHASACLNTSEISNAPTRGYVMDRRVAGSIHMPYKQTNKQANKHTSECLPFLAAGGGGKTHPAACARQTVRAVGRRGRACWRSAHACTLECATARWASCTIGLEWIVGLQSEAHCGVTARLIARSWWLLARAGVCVCACVRACICVCVHLCVRV